VSPQLARAAAADIGSGGNLTLYTSEEAAAILRVTTSWLERQAAARRVPFTMLGGGYRFTAEHLAQIVDIFEEAAAPRAPASTSTVVSAPRLDQQPGTGGLTGNRLRPRPGRQSRSTA
jgi:excisionase family DNA binding protein